MLTTRTHTLKPGTNIKISGEYIMGVVDDNAVFDATIVGPALRVGRFKGSDMSEIYVVQLHYAHTNAMIISADYFDVVE